MVLLRQALAVLASAASIAVADVAPPAKADGQVVAYPFDLTQVQLTTSRWSENQDRSLAYLHFVDVNRLLYVFRQNHKISTNGAQSNGGWDAPSFPFRSHMQGHILSAWAQCFASLGDATCKSQAQAMTAGMLACQNNNAAGFATGYLSGFPESDFTALEQGKLTSGNVPYYVIHKIMAGLLDTWRIIGDANAKTAVLALAGWVDTRTAKLSTSQMQSVLGTEHGGMMEVLYDLYYQTGDSKWITTAQRFYHSSALDPLANNQDQLNGQHGNTNIPKWIGCLRGFKATGTAKLGSVGRNAWNIVISAHLYAIGGTTEAEHWHAPNAIASYLQSDTAESCDTYNMLKLTRELWLMNPTVAYADFYEQALLNQMLGQQNPADSHGAITYFSSMNPGGKRGLGPAWGGGTWSTDYNSFWCCHGTGLETQTKLYDSIYFYDNSSLYVNLFTPSVLKWTQQGITITQSTNFPTSGTSTLTIAGTSTGTWSLKVRIPSWTTSAATIAVNGAAVSGLSITPGSYATVSRTWASGDVVTVSLPMALRLVKANDNAQEAAVAFGPTVLVGNYGSSSVSSAPTLTLSSVKRTSTSGLNFTATAGGKSVNLLPWFDGQGFNYVTYWMTSGSFS